MALLDSPRPDAADAAGVLRHLPSVGVLAAIIALFAGVGSGLPSTSPPQVEVARPTERPRQAPNLLNAPADPALPAPESDPEALANISSEDAMRQNAALPLSGGPNPAAAAFNVPGDLINRTRSIDCMTAAIYYEAGLEPVDGQRAVAQVVLNRMRHPAYPNTVCGVVFQGAERSHGCQFSFTCSGMLRRTPDPRLWEHARQIAAASLSGYVFAPVGLATHYHADYVYPNWAPTLSKVIQIGRHIFYRWGPPTPSTFTARYAGAEPDIHWRGGFGQGDAMVATAVPGLNSNALTVPLDGMPVRPGETAPPASRDSFAGAVLRRYDPVNSDNAGQIIESRIAPETSSTASRWAQTGRTPAAEAQRPLGREGPAPLEGVRRRPGAAPANSSDQR